MQHMVNAMTADVHANEDVWYVDSGASNHMTSRGEWFRDMKELNAPKVMLKQVTIQLTQLLTLARCP